MSQFNNNGMIINQACFCDCHKPIFGPINCLCFCKFNNPNIHYYSDGDLSAINGQLSNIEKRINACEQNYPSLWNRLAKLEENCLAAHPIKLSERVKDIEYRLEHIIALPSELDIRLQDVERRAENSGSHISDIRAKMADLRGMCLHPTKPHKCPVCDGTGGVKHPLTSLIEPAKCHGCEGKGLVWG